MLTRSQTTRRVAWGTLAATMVATIVTAVAPNVSATPPPPNAGPPSGDGIAPIAVSGNVSCADLNADGKSSTAYPINKRGADATLARDLASYLDQYNNGMICSGS